MTFPSDVDLVLIASILGIIAISVYTLYLQDKLLSRIEKLEKSITSARASEKKSGKDPELVVLSDEIGAANEILESTGKDIDSINSKISSISSDLDVFSQKIGAVRADVFENKTRIDSIQSEISVILSKLEPAEKETAEETPEPPPLEF